MAACLEKTISRTFALSVFSSFSVFLLNTKNLLTKLVELMFIICLLYQQSAATAGINGPQDESDTQQKFEATAENNAASNRSGGDAACIQRNKDLIEKGSDAQSSCAEAYPSEIKTQELDIHLGQAVIAQDSHAGGKFLSFTAMSFCSTRKEELSKI